MMTLSLEQMKANRKLWVDALRSGKYEQGPANLLHEGRYCCLGVLAVCAGYTDEQISGFGTLGAFPNALSFVGLKGCLGGFSQAEDGGFLADVNDSGVPFSEIADIIESEPNGLFIESVQP